MMKKKFKIKIPTGDKTVWKHPDTKFWKLLIIILTVGIVFLTLFLFLLYIFGYIPSLPPIFLSFAIVFYIYMPVIVIGNFITARSKSIELFLLFWIINVLSMLLQLWIVFVIFYQLAYCITNMSLCTILYYNEIIEFVILFISIIIAIFMIIIVGSYQSIINRSKNVAVIINKNKIIYAKSKNYRPTKS